MKSSSNIVGNGSKSAINITEWKPTSIVFEELDDHQHQLDEAEEIVKQTDKVFTIDKERQIASFFASSLLMNGKSSEKNLIKNTDEINSLKVWKPEKFSFGTEKTKEENDLLEERDSQIFGDIQQKKKELELLEAEIEVANSEAEIIIQTARENAQRLLRETEEQIEEIKERAYQEGIKKAEDDAVEILKSASIYLDESRNWRKKIFTDAEGDMVNMVQAITRKIFGEGIGLKPEQLEQAIVRAISEANRLGNLRVYMNSDDHDKLYSLWQDSELTVNGQKIQLVKSQNIKPGGCFIEGEFGSVDSRIDVQLELVQNEISSVLSTSQGELNDEF